jgi:hypothetical protein
VKIEVLFFKGCPNHLPTVDQVRRALDDERIAAEVEEVEIAYASMAQAVGFLGSPSVRVDGLDIEIEARGAGSFGFGCRTYVEAGRRSGVPPLELIRAALAEASGGRGVR